MNVPSTKDIDRWVEKTILNGLVHVQAGGAFDKYLQEMINHKILCIFDELVKAGDLRVQECIEAQKDALYLKVFKQGQLSVSDTSAYDNGYREGYKDATKIAEENRRWDSFKIGDMK